MKPTCLLHICCAPCAIYVWQLLSERYTVSGFFYYPNIYPDSEYRFRLLELRRIAQELDWEIIAAEYDNADWLQGVSGLESEPERGKRCSRCFHIRLSATFQAAKRLGFSAVASTLSISSHKNARQINREGTVLAAQHRVAFIAENFKKQGGFEKSRQLAIKYAIKHQNYCGCIFSFQDRSRRIGENRRKNGPET